MNKKFVVLAKPVSTNSLYGYNNGRKFLSSEGRAYKDKIIDAIGAVDYIFDGKVQLELKFYTKNVDQDLDNYLKSTIDAITESNVWFDDSQVFQIMAIKEYSDEYKVEIKIEGNCTKLINQKTILLIFEKVENITDYLKEMKNQGFKVVMGRKEVFINGDKYKCMSKRQLKKLNTEEEVIYYEKTK